MIGWFRSYHGAPSHRKWGLIAKRAGVPRPLVVALAWDLLDRGSQAADRGCIAGYDIDSFAFDMECEPADVLRILEAMRGADFLAGERLSGWERRQVKREDTGASERQKERRAAEKVARKAAEHDQLAVGDLLSEAQLDNPESAVTHCHAESRTVTPDKKREDKIDTQPSTVEPEPSREAGPSRADDLRSFERDCRGLFPERDQPKGSFAPMALLMERGAKPDELIVVLRAEAAKHRDMPIASWPGWAVIVGSRLDAPQPRKPGPPKAPPPRFTGRKVNTPRAGALPEDFLRAEHAAGRWTAAFGPAPGLPGCVLPN